MKDKIKKCLSFLLVFIMLFSSVPLVFQSAAEDVNLYEAGYPRNPDDPNGRDPARSDGDWGKHSALTFKNGWSLGQTTDKVFLIHTKDGYYGKVVYCIEPGAEMRNFDKTHLPNSTMDSNAFWSNVYPNSGVNNGLSASDARALLGQILAHGYQGNGNLDWRMRNPEDRDEAMYAYATQLLVWEVIVGERDASFNHINPGSASPVKKLIENFPDYAKETLNMHYDNIEREVKSFFQNVPVLPSFASASSGNAPTYEMTYADGKYTVTLHNENGNLNNGISISSELTDISFSKSGRDLIITCTEEFEGILPVHMSYSASVPDPVMISNGVLQSNSSGGNIQDLIYLAGGSTTIQIDGYFNLNFPHVHKYIPFFTDPDCIHRGYITWVCRCGDSYVNNYTDPLGHNFCPVSEKMASCETGGEIKYVCTRCGASYITTSPATGHSDPVWIINKQPTCTMDGEYVGFCTTCGMAIQSKPIPATGHGATVWKIDVEATPEHDGRMTEYCSVCGEAVGESKTFSMHTHEAGMEMTLLEATCTTAGETGVFCKSCGGCFETKPIDPLGHSDEVAVTTTPATCKEDGEKTIYCSRCGFVIGTETIPAGGHREGVWVNVTEATCTTAGKKVCLCEVCGESFDSKEIPALGHDDGVWNISIPATCTTSGEETLICTRCKSVIQTRSIDALGHTVGAWVTTIRPTCTTEGERICSCSRCGLTIDSEKLPATDHDNGVWMVDFEPNSEHDGQMSRYCTICWQVLESKTFEPHPHKEGYRQTLRAATCTTDGQGGIFCETCGAIYKTYTIDALGHDYGAWSTNNDGTHCKTCSRCHDLLTGNCFYNEYVLHPTCTTGGYTTHTCSICGFTYVDSFTDMLGHSFGEWKDDGDGSTHSRTCSRCILTETEAHSWGDWEFNHDANLFRNGSKTRVCSVCGGTQIDKANHTSWLSRVFYPIYLFFCNFFNKIVYGASLNWLFPEKTIPYEI